MPGLAFLLFWEFATHDNSKLRFFFSTPLEIAKTFIQEIQTAGLWLDFLYTSFAAVGGLAVGTILGSVLGLCFWLSPRFETISRPYMLILGAVPVFALAPMLILWFGIGLSSKIVMSAFAVFLVAATQSYAGARYIAENHLVFAQSLGAPRRWMLRYVLLPGSVQWILTGIRMNIGFALIGTFIAEFISSEHGLGHYILKAGGLYDMARVFVGLILMALLSLGLQQATRLLRQA